MAINFTTLFTRLGKGMYAQELINTSRGTTVPAAILAYGNEFNSASLALKKAFAPSESASRSYQSGANGAMTTMRDSMANVIIETVDADTPLDSRDIKTALVELIRQMVAASEDVDASTGTVSAGAIAGNGDGVLVASAKRADGKNNENLLAETILLSCISAATPATAVFQAKGDAAVADRLSSDWPGGSGAGRSVTAIDAANSLLANGDFDDEDDRANTPDDWILSVGTIGTTVKMTDYEVQSLTVTGPPTAGTYTISWQDPDGETHTTAPLVYSATASAVQAALRLLPGLSAVTVTATGTSPNWTHTITFVGVAGNLSQITVTNNSTGGTYTPGTTTAGSASAYAGKAVEFDSDGSQLTTLNQAVTLAPLTQYAFCCRMLADVVPAAGVITIDLVDGIGGTVVADEAGTNNSFTVDCTALTTSFTAVTGVFRTPRVLPAAIYLRIRISTGVSSGTSIFIDHAALGAMTELYAGGPSAAIFSGKVPFRAGSGQVLPDRFTLTATNDRAGEFQEWFDRNWDMRGKGLLLPSVTDASETQADTLIA